MANWPGPAGLADDQAALAECVWQAPLVSVALAVTAGVVVDRYFGGDFVFALLLAACSLVGFLLTRLTARSRLPVVYLAVAVAALGAAYHHYRRELCRDDDIRFLVSDRPRPVRLFGMVEEEPKRLPVPRHDVLRTQPMPATAATVVAVTQFDEDGAVRPISGRVRLVVNESDPKQVRELLPDVHAGDEVAIDGRLIELSTPAGPGEFDQAGYWRDRGVGALVSVRHGRPDERVTLVREGWRWSPAGWLGVLRTHGHRVLDERMPRDNTRALSRALLLGEGAPMTPEEWGKYVRTGVVHVLAISGQHLVVVATFLWWASRALGVRQRRTAVLVACVLFAYALLTGARPPALRSAVAASAVCVALILRRPALPANLFALAWLAVAAVNPTDLFDQGCQLSFLAVAVLCWGAARLLGGEEDPLDRLVEESWPRRLGRMILESYLLCLVVWLAVTPLIVYHTNLLPTAVLLLGPPLTLLTSIALLFGFVLLAVGWSASLSFGPAWVVHWCLSACETLVNLVDAWSSHLHVGTLPLWLVLAFYAVLAAWLTVPAVRRRWRRVVLFGPVWLCLAVVVGGAPRGPNELRCTFLAVGHGTCVVLEMPDGRTLLYDAGSMRGPDVAARVIAPYLWSRHVRRLDEVILSHADLDHFNSLTGLFDRFAVGRVLCFETFPDRPSPAVRHTLAELSRRRVPLVPLRAGDRLSSGGVTLEVLHPPAGFYQGNENARSLVVLVRHGESTILLTGDLEGEGLEFLLRQPRRPVDVLQAPHHGSHRLNVKGLLDWCRPKEVVSCQGAPRGRVHPAELYAGPGRRFWSTHERGAVTVISGRGKLTVEPFGKAWRVMAGEGLEENEP